MSFIRPAFKFAPPPATQPEEVQIAVYAPDYQTVGYKFSIDTPKIINALGYYRSQTGVGTVNAIVTLWDHTGVMLATTGIASTCTYSQDNFCWITIPAVKLPANPNQYSWYVIGVTYQSEEVWVIDSYGTQPTQILSSATGYGFIGGIYSLKSSELNNGNPGLPITPIFPNILLDSDYNQGFFGPNLSYLPELANGAYTEYGFKFTASENKTVRGVGVHDVAADGLESNVRVKVEGITNPGNNWTFNVGIGSTLPLVKGYRYQELSAFTLPAGDYRIFAQDTSVVGVGTTLIQPAFKFAPPPATQPEERNLALYAPDYATLGYTFSIDTPKIINALGYYRSQTGVGTVNAIVTLWDHTGVMLATTGIASTCTYSQDNFCWIPVPEFELPANPNIYSWYVIGVTYQAEELWIIDSYGTQGSQDLEKSPGFIYHGGIFSSSSSELNGGTPALPMQPIFPTTLLNDQYNAGIFGPNISYIDTNPLKIAKNTSTVSEVSGILYTNNIKRNPLTTGITTITADGNAYFGPVLFVEVYN